MPNQNYQNHTQRVPVFMAVALTLLATIIGSSVNLYQSFGDHQRLYCASLLLVLSVCLLFTLFLARIFALKVQDRAVRAEENLRHFALTGKLLPPQLTIQQIIALRFASDPEYLPLIDRAIQENLDQKSIKLAIQNWRADTYRA
ncbi:MAG: DUF6526 family protein [Bryobacter sp.]|nr:DUF6526 family protein [Bryobacter sp. CoA8 C33]